ncbi:hypothetical protein PNEG_01985 [Pneumocystis murina B123]|uniref:HIT domain-containing protein n=1 Tax=Pneumocystis murina (strain B123) TaxID=1069680 RepID=M7PH88_PNEMU|nr:hypothetical protein PNEG_01985 [Pneumocystis murina B123]EMR09804.1 hypothetical protein PNEG_01985 [Pneumocystis murina B123]
MISEIYFGPFLVSKQVFFHAKNSLALVNLKPVLPGHVLVIPRRPVPRLRDLTESEILCLFSTVQKVSSVVEKAFCASSCTVTIQDGKYAGQTVPHLHVHIIPRKPYDLKENDEIYERLASEDADLGKLYREKTKGFQKIDDADRKPRSDKEMEEEARWLEEFFDFNNIS